MTIADPVAQTSPWPLWSMRWYVLQANREMAGRVEQLINQIDQMSTVNDVAPVSGAQVLQVAATRGYAPEQAAKLLQIGMLSERFQSADTAARNQIADELGLALNRYVARWGSWIGIAAADVFAAALSGDDVRADPLSHPQFFRAINPGWTQDATRRVNCMHCVIALDRWLAGFPAAATPNLDNGESPPSALRNLQPASSMRTLWNSDAVAASSGVPLNEAQASTGIAAALTAIHDELVAAGHGARGVVRLRFETGIHYVNVFNREGRIFLADAQVQRLLVLEKRAADSPPLPSPSTVDALPKPIAARYTDDPSVLRVFVSEQIDIYRSHNSSDFGQAYTALLIELRANRIDAAVFARRADTLIGTSLLRAIAFMRTDRPQ